MSEPHKTCNRCGEAKSVSEFYRAKGNTDGLKSSCKACHAAKYSSAVGYISPSNAAAKAATAARIKHCDFCDRDVLRSEWPRQANGHLSPRCEPCLDAYKNKPLKPIRNRTPEERAAYRRKRGEVATEYVLRAVTLEIAALKRIAKANAAPRERKPYVALPRPVVDDAHVRLFRSRTIQWRVKYKTDPEFAIKQRLRTQVRKKARLHPKLDDLMRAAINRGGSSRTVADVCGYTIKELKTHLEALFTDGMDWQAFMRGEIHIDHIKPQRLFDLSDAGEVRACWALSNLQPLWRADNLRKGGKHAPALGACNETERYSWRVSEPVGIARRDLSASA
ncbi:hypothetical protein [Paraburkholderia fungorum]